MSRLKLKYVLSSQGNTQKYVASERALLFGFRASGEGASLGLLVTCAFEACICINTRSSRFERGRRVKTWSGKRAKWEGGGGGGGGGVRSFLIPLPHFPLFLFCSFPATSLRAPSALSESKRLLRVLTQATKAQVTSNILSCSLRSPTRNSRRCRPCETPNKKYIQYCSNGKGIINVPLCMITLLKIHPQPSFSTSGTFRSNASCLVVEYSTACLHRK